MVMETLESLVIVITTTTTTTTTIVENSNNNNNSNSNNDNKNNSRNSHSIVAAVVVVMTYCNSNQSTEILSMGMAVCMPPLTYLPYSTPSEIDLGLFWADVTNLEGTHLFHRIG